MSLKLTKDAIDRSLGLLSGRLDRDGVEPVRLVICGGSALIAMGYRSRTTNDVDVVAMMDETGQLVSPDPLPTSVLVAATQVARDLGLNENWLNNGPSNGEGGLFQLGLPEGFAGRLTERVFGPRLKVYFIGRIDQIHFKLYAAADQRDATHMSDLRALNPTAVELETAARWTMTHDVSDGFKVVLRELLEEMGYASVAQNI